MQKDIDHFIISSALFQDIKGVLLKIIGSFQGGYLYLLGKMYDFFNLYTTRSVYLDEVLCSLGVPRSIVERLNLYQKQKLLPLVTNIYKLRGSRKGLSRIILALMGVKNSYIEASEFWWVIPEGYLADEMFILSKSDNRNIVMLIKDIYTQVLTFTTSKDLGSVVRKTMFSNLSIPLSVSLRLCYTINSNLYCKAGVGLILDNGVVVDVEFSDLYKELLPNTFTMVDIKLADIWRTYPTAKIEKIVIFDKADTSNIISVGGIYLIDIIDGNIVPVFCYRSNINSSSDYIAYTIIYHKMPPILGHQLSVGDKIIFGFDTKVTGFDFTINTPVENTEVCAKFYNGYTGTWDIIPNALGSYQLDNINQSISFGNIEELIKSEVYNVKGFFVCLEIVSCPPDLLLPNVTSVSNISSTTKFVLSAGGVSSIDDRLLKDVLSFIRPVGCSFEVVKYIDYANKFEEDTKDFYWSPSVRVNEENKLDFPINSVLTQILLSKETITTLGIKDLGISCLIEPYLVGCIIDFKLCKVTQQDFYKVRVDVDNNKILVYNNSVMTGETLLQEVSYPLSGDRMRIVVVKDGNTLLVSINGNNVLSLICDDRAGNWEINGAGFKLSELLTFQVPAKREVI